MQEYGYWQKMIFKIHIKHQLSLLQVMIEELLATQEINAENLNNHLDILAVGVYLADSSDQGKEVRENFEMKASYIATKRRIEEPALIMNAQNFELHDSAFRNKWTNESGSTKPVTSLNNGAFTICKQDVLINIKKHLLNYLNKGRKNVSNKVEEEWKNKTLYNVGFYTLVYKIGSP